MTAPSPTGQSPDAVHEAVARVIHGVIADFYAARGFPLAKFEEPEGAWWRRADQACAGPLAPLLAQRDAAIARAEEAERDRDAADAANEALDIKLKALAPHGTCACSYDTPDDVCMHHSPALASALAEVATLTADLAQAKAQVAGMQEALEFYADPDTYAAIGFFPDRPCGEFVDDFSDEHDPGYPKPGKRARAAVTLTEATHAERS